MNVFAPTLTELNALFDLVVEQRGPDYVYEKGVDPDGSLSCLYVHDRDSEDARPGCIVGAVYTEATGELVPSEFEFSSAQRLFGDHDYESDPTVLAFRVQEYQDAGFSWGEAVERGRADFETWVSEARPRLFGRVPNFPSLPRL